MPSETRIHHLSDLHFGRLHGTSTDNKDLQGRRFEEVIGQSYTTDYLKLLREDPSLRPHFIAITGDLASIGSYDEIGQAVSFVDLLLQEDLLLPVGEHPPQDRVFIVPGNHDVDWSVVDKDEALEAKFSSFCSQTRLLVTPFCTRPDPKGVAEPCPFRWFPEVGLFFYCFNSSLLGGEYVPAAKALREEVQTLCEQDSLDAAALQEKLTALARIDPGCIAVDDIHAVSTLIRQHRDSLDSGLAPGFDASLRLALTHHHVNHFPWNEAKQFESFINAGQFKQELMKHQFDIVLHGHKHEPRVFFEEHTTSYEGRGLFVAAAGSLSGRIEGTHSFNIVRVQHDGGRIAVDVTLVPHTGGEFRPQNSIGSLQKIVESTGGKARKTHTKPAPLTEVDSEYVRRVRDTFGLRSVCRERTLVDEYQDLVAKAQSRIWVLGICLTGFRTDHKDALLPRASSGVDIRLLVLDPSADIAVGKFRRPFPEWQDVCEREGALSERIKANLVDIETLRGTVAEINKQLELLTAPNKRPVQLRYYRSFPTTMVFLIDDVLYFGPYFCHCDSLKTVTFECTAGSVLYEAYSSHFGALWEDKRLTREAPA